MPVEPSLRLGCSRPHYRTGYYIYQLYDPTAKLSRPLRSWTPQSRPDSEVLRLINRAGTDIAPAADSAEGRRLGMREESGEHNVQSETNTVLTRITGPAMIRAIEFSVPRESVI